LSFFRSADNSVIKRTACTCHNYNNNNDNKINNEEFLLVGLKGQVMKLEKIISYSIVSSDVTLDSQK